MADLNLREQAESDLGDTLEGEFALPVVLIGPGGITQTVNGQVLYDTIELNSDTGEPIVVNKPNVTLRRSSLTRIPVAGEVWFVEIPRDPNRTAELDKYVMTGDKPPAGGRSLGTITLYLQKATQV